VLPCGERAALPRVCEILHAAFAAHDGRIDPPSGAHRETPETIAAKLDHETLLVAQSAGDGIVGCIFCTMESPGAAYIGRLAVDPGHQGRGIARALLLASIAWAREQGASSVALGVRVELTENIAFFERHGFAITRADAHLGYDRPTNYHMELDLSGAGH
jgi:ribosomal protein S18 acetylase RimI-like enzyme